MNDSPSSSKSLAPPNNKTSTIQPEMFRRTFHCGHLDEVIEVIRDDEKGKIHNLVTFETFEAVSRPYRSLPAYNQARCLACAKAAKEQDDRNPTVGPKKTLGTYQAVSTLTGFEGVLLRYSRGADRDSNRPHPRVSEVDHYAHHLDMSQKAVFCAGSRLAVPARRVQNMPIRMKDAARPAPRQLELDLFKENEDVDCLKETDYCRPENIIEAIATMEGLSGIPHGKRSKAVNESYRIAAANCRSSSACRREREKRRLAEIATQGQLDLTAADSEEDKYDRMVEAPYSQEASDVLSTTTSHEALLGHHNAHNRSPLDVLSRLSLKSQNYQQPRPAPAAPSAPISPRKGALDFIRRRGSASTRGHSRYGSTKMNFRKLSIDIRPTKSLEKTDFHSDSSDWACQTSQAIERGEILMDSVSKQGQELIRSKHVTQDMHSPIDRRNTYPSSAVDLSPAAPWRTRHSEGAPQALRASASRRHGRLIGMEITSPTKETSKHDSAQGALAVDLNKRLPALPPQTESDDGEDQVEYIWIEEGRRLQS